MPVTVVTDTTQYMPPDMLAAAGVKTVSLYINDGGSQRAEADITDLAAYYERLRDTATLPTTSQPSVGDFLACYEPLLADGQDIVSLHISGGISGTVESARQAATDALARFPGRQVEVVDSRSTAGGMGMMVLAAAAAARGGRSADAVASRAREAVDAARIWFAVDTLEYLRRGGRIGTAQAWLGGALKIKPILTLDGEITPIERVRTSRRAFERMVEFGQTLKDDGSTIWCVQHIQAHEEAERLVGRAREVLGCDPLAVSEVGPVIGTHVGPGLLGIGGVPPALLED